MPGQEEGNAFADLLCGSSHPAGLSLSLSLSHSVSFYLSFYHFLTPSSLTHITYPNSPSLLPPSLPFLLFPSLHIYIYIYAHTHTPGRLPLTIPNVNNEMQFTTQQYPGIDNEVDYTEGLLVGYRWYNAKGVKPHYPFGYGLSYTSFAYQNIQISTQSQVVTVQFSAKNVGSRVGTTVPQLYLTYPAEAQEPPRQLRGFESLFLRPGQKSVVFFHLREKDFSIWDVASHSFVLFNGNFTLEVGYSSQDIALVGSVNVPWN